MSVQVRRRREAASFLASFVGAQGELIVDTTNNRVQVHDGTTPGGWPAAKIGEVVTNARTSVADTAYTALATDRTIAFTALTATRAVTLPAAAAYPTGTRLVVVDETGACSTTVSIAIAAAGSDKINGLAAVALVTPYGVLAFQSNGSGKWTITDQSAIPNRKTFTDVALLGGSSTYGGSFTRVPLSTVNADTGGNWDSSNYWYTCPRSGIYQITGSLRVGSGGNDASYNSAQYGVGVYTTEADGPWFLWHFTPPTNTALRSTYPYGRLSYQNAGDKLRMFTFSDYSGGIIVYTAGLQICLVSDAV